MPRLVLAHGAGINLLEITDHIAETSGSLAVADRFANELLAKCEQLAGSFGTMGTARPELLTELRSIAYTNYVIFFRYVKDTFEIVNIIEGHREIPLNPSYGYGRRCAPCQRGSLR